MSQISGDNLRIFCVPLDPKCKFQIRLLRHDSETNGDEAVEKHFEDFHAVLASTEVFFLTHRKRQAKVSTFSSRHRFNFSTSRYS